MNFKYNKIASDSIFLLAAEFLIKFKGIIFLPLIISRVGLENYGIFVQVLINPSIIASLCSMSLNTNFLRYTSKFSNNEKNLISKDFYTIFLFSFLLSILGAYILYLLSPAISNYILSSKSTLIIKISSIIVINEVLWRNLGFFLKSRKKFKLFSTLFMFYNLLPYLGFVFGIIIYSDILHGIIGYILIQVSFNFILLIILIKDLQFEYPSIVRFKKFISYSWALPFSNLSGGLLSKADRYFIGFFMGPASIGIYNILYQVISLIDQLTIPFRNYIGTYLPKQWDNNNRIDVLNKIRLGVLLYLVFSILLAGLFVLYLEPFLVLIIDSRIVQFDYYYYTIISIILGLILLGINRFYYQVINLYKKNHFQLFLQLFALIINIILNVKLIPMIGLLGAGISTLISYFIIIVMNHYFFNIPYKIKPDLLFLV
ncbi:polysaccharide biosynthesis C-terminal domain-containing protein, partial [Candidatus Marinimicrobia bacterium]|nr:polysaccharide biosynthesis C-terminal domain-containing protein [Candidatus Neomarinimicrobiota bacterium]